MFTGRSLNSPRSGVSQEMEAQKASKAREEVTSVRSEGALEKPEKVV